MNYKDLSRPLEISDVDFRVQSINNGGYATILAYKDARVDMNRLDEVLTPLGWQRDYKLIDGKLFCGVGIWHEYSGQWIWKWDVGTESNTESEKGQASDSFKRACFNLGIGRELYDYPIISVRLLDHEWTKEGGRPKQTYNLKIRDWTWYSEFTDGKISFLAAKDENGNVRFKWGAMAKKDDKPAEQPKQESAELPKGNEDTEREMLVQEYKALFGKAPHGKMSNESIREKIEEETSKILEEVSEEASSMTILNHLDEVYSHTEPSEFISWAKEIVSKYSSIDSPDILAKFKDECNSHYAKITK